MRLFKSIIALLFIFQLVHSKEITDMLNRSVTIPDQPSKIYAPSPYSTYALYAIDPTLLVGWIFDISEENYQFLHPRMKTLPTIGRLFGAGQNANLEVLLSKNPDLIVMWKHSNEFTAKEEEMLKILNSPYIYVVDEDITDYVKIFRFLGKALNREERGNKLADYSEKIFQKTIKTVEKTAKNKRPRVYYAEGVDGLSTECDDSIHVQLLKLAGDVNVHRCKTTSHKGFEKVSMERILKYDPQVIIVQDQMFYDKIYKSPIWSKIDAVKNKKVYLIPKAPFNWFDRPPSFMRIMSLNWLMNILYPDDYKIDLKSETKEFYKLFMGVDLSQKQLEHILQHAK